MFALALLDLNTEMVLRILEEQGADLTPPRRLAKVLNTLEGQGLERFAHAIRSIGSAGA